MASSTIGYVFFALLAVAVLQNYTVDAACTNVPGDVGWPTAQDWTALNSTVGGRLIATTPRASVCHDAPFQNYNSELCSELAAGWDAAQTFEPYPGEIINAYYQNQSCDPFTPASKTCELGNYPSFSIDVNGPEDVVAGLNFSNSHNVRLVVRSTGHDYVGRSSGHGSLSLWMWNLKSVAIDELFTSASYSGPAIKLGAGVIVGDATIAAHAAGYRLVGGECGSVGIASGYSQGGGHSMLNTAYGMASDQILEWEVVTPAGEYLVATPTQHADLFWALSGGGGGTYGITLGATVRIYQDGPIAGGVLGFANTNDTAYWKAIGKWFERSSQLVGQNNSILFVVLESAFQTVGITLPGQPESAVSSLLADFMMDLESLGIQYFYSTSHSDSYLDHYNTTFGPLPYGANNPTTMLMSRIIPRSVTSSESAVSNLMDTYRSVVAGGDFLLGCLMLDVQQFNGTGSAVLPAWRDGSVACNVNAYWNYTAPIAQNLALKTKLAEVHMPAIEAATPGGGVYGNEMDQFYVGDWKRSVFGSNYDRLLDVKQKYDPDHILWGSFNVASDQRALDAQGRLCTV